MLSVDVYYLQSTWAYAAPEVLAYNLQPCDQLFEKIKFQKQDCWSLGYLLVWLLIGTDPFSLPAEELAELDIQDSSDLQQALRHRQGAWVRYPLSSRSVISSSLCRAIA